MACPNSGWGTVYGALSYSLLRGVQELVLAAPAVTDPEARICPEAADCVHVASLQLVDVHCVDVLQPLGVDLVLGVEVGYFENGHGSCHGLHGCENVLEDAFGKAPPLLL